MRRTMIAAGVLGLVLSACGGTSVFSMEVGMCFDDEDVDAEQISSVPEVACSEPHDNEVYYLYDVSFDSFPGDDLIAQEGFDRCVTEFATYVGIDYMDSDLGVYPLTPTAESWDNDDREIICVLYDYNLDKLEGSMRGAAR